MSTEEISDERTADSLTMTVEVASKRIGVGADWLARQARAGLVPHVKLGRSRRFTEENLRQILISREQTPSDPWIRSPRSQARRRRVS